jgi:hypothetical protein
MMAKNKKRRTQKSIVILICVLAIPILSPVSNVVNGHQALQGQKAEHTHSQGNIATTLYIGIVRDVHHNGGWEPSISAHVISVLVLSNQRPHVQMLINKDIIIAECAWLGWIGSHTIFGIYAV